MQRNVLDFVVFALGLAAVCWIGAGYVGTNTLALAFTLLIAVCYIAGALELHRYRQATASLESAVAGLADAPSSLRDWIATLHPSLRNATRLRIEGERVALPGPALTPYLVGLLVLLGMLGTLLGMMATLRGTGLALESATDLDAIRGSLAAPVKGLGFAFGTSIAGVAASAMLGLLSALSRRARLQAVQQLDARIATTLHGYSQSYQREESFRLLQRQAELMPDLVERLQAMVAAIEQQNQAGSERQLASQEAFHARTEAAYTRLAGALEQALQAGVADSSRAVAATLQPMVEATLAGLARESAQLHDGIGQAVQRQLDGVSSGIEKSAAAVSDAWTSALAEQRRTNETLTSGLRATLDAFGSGFEQRAGDLLDAVATRLDSSTSGMADAWNAALTRQDAGNTALAERNQQALEGVTARFATQADALLASVDHAHTQLQAALADHDAQRLAAWTEALAAAGAGLREDWQRAGAQAAAQQQSASDALHRTAQQIADQAQAQSEQTIAGIAQLARSTADAAQASAEATAARQQAICDALAGTAQAVAAAAQTQSEQTIAGIAALARSTAEAAQASAEATATQQQAICDTLARTAQDITRQAQAHAEQTIAEISRLVQTASEAPKAAADVVAELREKLSDSMVRDTAMLEERSRLLATLETLLDAVNHASTEQRGAVDALVATSADLLDRVGTRFADQVQAQTGRLDAVAAQVTGSAVEVASLGEALGAAVQLFGTSNEQLLARLQEIGAALDRSLTRSDEQLAYYVAQAREVIDLSMLSQQQIVADLQRLAATRGAEPA